MDNLKSSSSSTARNYRILIVDDNEDAARGLALLLEVYAHQVRVAHQGETVLQLAQTWKPEVVILDIGLPGMDGYSVARELRRQQGSEEMRLIALSGHGQEEDRRLAFEVGFDEYLVKPAGPEELLEALTERSTGDEMEEQA